MSIDRGDAHFRDAGTWTKACRHIALFLWWAAERGLSSSEVDATEMAAAPTRYFIDHCDTKLWDEDLTVEGNAFAAAAYNGYLGAVSEYARSLGIGDYDIPPDEKTQMWFFGWLDRRFAMWKRSLRSDQ
jgi:hypothetical protein